MPNPESSKTVISESLLEIRYKPNSKIIDRRGTWAELISNHMNLDEWRVDTNRIDIHDKANLNRAFVAFRNAGFITRNVPTPNFFPDQAVKLFRYLFSMEGFGKSIIIERFGLRQRFASTFHGSFEDLRDRYSTRFLALTDAAKEAINAEIVDIGGPLNFRDRHGHFNTMSGPMRSSQLQEFFPEEEEYPEVSFYFDIDYWLRPNKETPENDVIKWIKTFAQEGWARHERVRDFILER